MLRTRRFVFLVLVSLVASIGLAVGPAAGSASVKAHPDAVGSSEAAHSMAAVNPGVPTARPDPKPNSAPVKTFAARPKPTAAITLSVQAPSPTTYGDTVQLTALVNLTQVAAGGTVRFTDGGIQIGSSPISGTGVAQMSTSTLRAGSHSFVATYTVATTAVASGAVSLNVAKRALHLYAAPPRWSRPVGAPNPASYTVMIPSGSEGDLINGDTLATAVSGRPKFTLTAGATSPAGTYPITLSALKSLNYSLVYLTAGYTVYTKDILAGDTAPEVTGKDQNGDSFSLSQLRGRVVLLDFSAVWCGPSNLLAHDVAEVASQLAARGIAFSYLPVLIDGPTPGVPGTQQNALNYYNKYKLPTGTHVLQMTGQAAALNQPLSSLLDSFYGYGAVPSDNFGKGAYPTMAMIDAHGVVREVEIGYGDGVDGLVQKLTAYGPDTGVQVTSAPSNPTTHHDATIEFTTTGDVQAQCSLDGAAFENCSSPYELANLADGAHQVAISIGAEADALVSWTVITLDTTITGGPGGGFIPAYNFVGTGVGFVCWTGGETPYHCESGWGIIDIPGGLQTFHVAAVDQFGNVDDTPATAEYTFQPLPTITLVPDNPNPGPSDAVTWTVTVTDATSGDPVTGSVQFYGPNGGSGDIALDASGTASYVEPAFFVGYSEDVLYTGNATHGAGELQVHVGS